MRTLLIADSNEDFRLALAEALARDFRILTCGSGTQTLELLLTQQPEILVLDVRMPELDGLTILERIRTAGVTPRILVFTPLLSDYEILTCQNLGVSYMMRKPCGLAVTIARIRDLAECPIRSGRNISLAVTDLLLSLPLPPRQKGFACLQTALPMMIRDPCQSITKELYPAVARKLGCQSRDVELGIRRILDHAWRHPDHPKLRRYFPDCDKRPSNGEFLARMAQILRRELE